MAARQWTTEEQRIFLLSWLALYLEAVISKTTEKFWPKVYEAWFKLWKAGMVPLPNLELEPTGVNDAQTPSDTTLVVYLRTLTPEKRVAWQVQEGLIMKQKQIQSWFRWRQNPLTVDRKGKGKSEPQNMTLLKQLGAEKGSRLHSLVQKYSTMYYPARVAPLVAEELANLGHTASASERLSIISRLTAEAWSFEDDGTIAAVHAALDEEKAAKLAAKAGGEKDTAERTGAQYQKAINDLPSILNSVFDELRARTGWSFTVLMGGPFPEAGGSIQSASHHVGNSQAGNNFEKAYPDFQGNIVEPFHEFLQYAYPREVRRARTLHHPSNQPVASSSSSSLVVVDRDLPALERLEVPLEEDAPQGANLADNISQSSEDFSNPFNMDQNGLGVTGEAISEAGSAFLHSLMPHASDYPITGMASTDTNSFSFDKSKPMVLDDGLEPPLSFEEELQRYDSEPSLMLPVRGDSQSPSSTPGSLRMPSPFDSPQQTHTSTEPARRSPTSLMPPSSAIPFPIAAVANPVTPVPPRQIITYASKPSAARAQPTPSVTQSSIEQERDRAVEARRAAFAALRLNAQAKPAAAKSPAATPLQSRLGTSDGIQAARLEAQRDADALAEGQAARDARQADEANTLAMKNAETVTAEANAKREKATQAMNAAKERSAAAALKMQEAAALKLKKLAEKKLAEELAEKENQATIAASALARAAQTTTALDKAAQRAVEAKERALKKATKKQTAKDKKAAQDAAEALRTRKIADVAAMSAAARLAAAPDSDASGLTPDCPGWMHEVVEVLKMDSGLGQEWVHCVKAWVLFEIAMNFADSGSHGNTKRPKEIAPWIKGHRNYQKPPAYVKTFGASCLSWWMHLQPSWRTNDGDIPHAIYTCEGGDWGELAKSGKNGLVMVLLSMMWWGCGAGNISPLWVRAVTDIRRSLESMSVAIGEAVGGTSCTTKPVAKTLKRVSASNALSQGKTKRSRRQ